ncbi:MAG: class I mannose-6-phosphate isomerase [Bacteroidales bacterium]|jgi:mannose-6-phosphate isomerase|nr:class I mannose-6-phosphate isomerase [Bacteroidales bacterium]
MMNKLYPMKFQPLLKEKIWGGTHLHALSEEAIPDAFYGEAWLLSGIEGEETVVLNGWLAENNISELIEIFMGDLVGDKVFEQYEEDFPLLFKLIDAADDLSIQVHPNDELAQKRNLERGKTEMWYVMEAEEGAELISGFDKQIDKESFQKLITQQRLESVLNREKVHAGDVFFMPAGRVHSIGKGILLAEIQQSSDTTYRIYDWGRKDAQENERELHVEEALDAIDFKVEKNYRTNYQSINNATIPVVASSFFNTNILSATDPIRKDFSELDSFVVYLCVEGALDLKYSEGKIALQRGEIILIPNAVNEIMLIPKQAAKVLEVYVP